MASATVQARDQLAALARADLSAGELGGGLSAALSRAVPHEGYCLIGFDPVSGLRVFTVSRDAVADSYERLWHNETVEHDLHRFTDLGQRLDPVGTLGGMDSAANCAWRSAAAASCGAP
jgi:hypothetical protein